MQIKNIQALICEQCLRILNEADEFKQKCLQADKYFQELLATNDSVIEDIYCILIKEEPRDYNEDTSKRLTEESSSVQKPNSESKPKAKRIMDRSRYQRMCGYCGKKQESEYRLRQHELLSHTPFSKMSPDEVLVCDLCARIFKTKSSIRSHVIRAHTSKIEKFPCSICGKVLENKKALNAHEQIHVKSEVTCQYCSKSFNRKILLKAHIANVHLKKSM